MNIDISADIDIDVDLGVDVDRFFIKGTFVRVQKELVVFLRLRFFNERVA